MTPHEQNLILKVADEVRTADRATVDREAERLIRAEVAAQPHAAYILTQRVIVQDLALQQARARIEELEGRLRQAGGSIEPAGGSAAPAAAPPGGGRSGVGDFLKTAAAAAAGTIGGQLIYDGLRDWAAGHGGMGSGLLGGLSGGSFLPGAGREHRATDTDSSDRGGGGDFAGDAEDEETPDEVQDDEDATDADEESDGDFGGGGDWGDDGS
jgi:hypothetical protein